MSHPWARLAPAPWADFFKTHPEIPVVAAGVPGSLRMCWLGSQLLLPTLPSVFGAGSAPPKPVAQFWLLS